MSYIACGRDIVFDSDICPLGKLWMNLCHCEAPLCGAVAISRKGNHIKKRIVSAVFFNEFSGSAEKAKYR